MRLFFVCVISLAEQDEEALKDFKEKKKAVDIRTKDLQRKNLHRQLKDDNLSETMDSLSHTKGDYSHLSVADQRLMNLMPLSRHENFTGSRVRESFYNVRDTCLSALRNLSSLADPLLVLCAVSGCNAHIPCTSL